MRDRTVRRRRATLAAFVIASLVMLTAYFGESGGGGPLHGVQSGFVDILNPIQEGANRALKPVRDLFGWVGDTLDAKDQRDKLRKERDELQARVAELDQAATENAELRQLLELDREGISAYGPITARIIGRGQTVWESKILINKGADDGIRVDQPVVASNDAAGAGRTGGALVGKVITVSDSWAYVKLISDAGFAIQARTVKSREPGLLGPEVGSGRDLVFDPVKDGEEVKKGERLITAGTVASNEELPSLAPPGIPIGRVRSIDEGEGPLTRVIKVEPAADLRRMQFVQVLTKRRVSRKGTP